MDTLKRPRHVSTTHTTTTTTTTKKSNVNNNKPTLHFLQYAKGSMAKQQAAHEGE
jgi:hypothetical protein